MKKVIEVLESIWHRIYQILETPLFPLGDGQINLGDLIYFIISVGILIWLSGLLRRILVRSMIRRYKQDPGIAHSTGSILRYIILVIGFIVILQTAGLNLSALGLLAGALGVGIGFGLQGIANNFISGIIILFERPVKVGDRIQVGEIEGDVVIIAARATTVITNDNIAIIIPNSEFINNQVINWSHNDRNIRFRFPVGVSYKEDPEKVKKIILEAAYENHGVLSNPPPDVIFEEYGDSSLNFSLIVWTSEFITRPKILKSQLYYSIFKKFRENQIEIPFPQRDLHIRSGLENFSPKN